MPKLTDAEKWKLLAGSDPNQAASDLGDKPAESAKQIASNLGVSYMVEVVSQLGTDAAVDLLRSLPEDFRDKIIKELDADKIASLRELLGYKPGSAGALMAKEYLCVPLDFNIRQTTEYLQSIPKNQKGKVSYIYVVDQNRRLEGVIQVRDLVFYSPDKSVREILRSPVVQVETGMSQLDVARLLQRHRYLGLPVVDAAQRLVGVISADNAMQVLEEEATDDIAKIVGTGAEEMRTHSVRKIMRLRTPWLFINIASGLACALIVGIFQRSLEEIAALFLFVPVVLGLAESTGVQGATIVVRNIALGRFSPKEILSLFIREMIVGALIGIICGGVVGAVAFQWQGNGKLGYALSSSLILAIFISALIGLLLPIIFRRFKVDPAMASGPLVLALCDLQALFVYFSVSGLILKA